MTHQTSPSGDDSIANHLKTAGLGLLGAAKAGFRKVRDSELGREIAGSQDVQDFKQGWHELTESVSDLVDRFHGNVDVAFQERAEWEKQDALKRGFTDEVATEIARYRYLVLKDAWFGTHKTPGLKGPGAGDGPEAGATL